MRGGGAPMAPAGELRWARAPPTRRELYPSVPLRELHHISRSCHRRWCSTGEQGPSSTPLPCLWRRPWRRAGAAPSSPLSLAVAMEASLASPLAQAGSRLPRLGGRYPAGGVWPWSARELAAALHGQRGKPCAIRRRAMNTSPAAADEPLPCTGERNKMKKSNLCMTCGSRLQVSGLFKKPQQLNQTGFQLSHNSFFKATFPEVTIHNCFFQKSQLNQTHP
jgi:hypothetical protein